MRLTSRNLILFLGAAILVATILALFDLLLSTQNERALTLKFIGYTGSEEFISVEFQNNGSDKVHCILNTDWVTCHGPPFLASTLEALRKVDLESHEIREIKLAHSSSRKRPNLTGTYYSKPNRTRLQIEKQSQRLLGLDCLDLTRLRRVSVSLDIPEPPRVIHNLEPLQFFQLTNLFLIQ